MRVLLSMADVREMQVPRKFPRSSRGKTAENVSDLWMNTRSLVGRLAASRYTTP